MPWPSPVTPGVTQVLGSQYNALAAALAAWGGPASAAGFALTDLPALQMHTTNATWQEFQLLASAGGSQSADTLLLQANARASAGAADSWATVASVAVASGGLTLSTPVTFNNAANVNFGTNWTAYTATITASGSMTVSSITVYETIYFRLGGLCFFHINLQLTLGGTVSNTVTFTLPISNPRNGQSAFCFVDTTAAIGSIIGSNVLVSYSGLGNYAAGTHIFNITGFYSVS